MKGVDYKMKAYIPVKKTKQDKPKIRGLWLSDRQGVCYDYIRKADIVFEDLARLQRQYKQEAIFYTDKGRAFIWYNNRRIEQLKFYKYFAYNRDKTGFKAYIKDLLKIYGGVTIYIKERQFLIEVWH